jgi:hypothetical protein
MRKTAKARWLYILTHTFDIVMGVFSLAQNVVNGSAGIIGGSLDIDLALTVLTAQLEAMGTGELLGLYIESAILSLAMKAISLCIFIIIYPPQAARIPMATPTICGVEAAAHK